MMIFKNIYILIIISVLFNGCTGVKTTVIGLDNESFLSFYSDNNDISDIH
jgi:uncharacterized protein YceK